MMLNLINQLNSVDRETKRILINFKEDLQIAATSKAVRVSLIETITQNSNFSKHFTEYFEPRSTQFEIKDTEPTQIVAFKKILNALDHLEKAVAQIETIDINPESQNLIRDIIFRVYNINKKLYTAVQLIDASSVEVQNIVGPHVSPLLSKIAEGVASMQHLSQAPSVREHFSKANNFLKTTQTALSNPIPSLSQLFFDLPNYFESLEQLLSNDPSSVLIPANISAQQLDALSPYERQRAIKKYEDYQSRLQAKVKRLNQSLEATMQAGEYSIYTNYLMTIKHLISHSADLVTTAAPLTKKAYSTAVTKLNEIRHDYLPKLISELEKIEETMALKPGRLTKPAIEEMNNYYTQLATQVDKIAAVSGVIDTTESHINSWYLKWLQDNSLAKVKVTTPLTPVHDLDVMLDDTFVTKRKTNQTRRLTAAGYNEEGKKALKAATEFFDQISGYNTYFWSARYRYNLSNISQDEKEKLIGHYKQFQPFLAKRYPEVDILITKALNQKLFPQNKRHSSLKRGGSLIEKSYQLWEMNNFSTVMGCQKEVLTTIIQSLAQSDFRTKLIKATMDEADQQTATIHNNITHLHTNVAAFKPLHIPFKDEISAGELHQQGLVFATEIKQLESALNAVREFYNQCSNLNLTREHDVSKIQEPAKELLRQAYKQFQPHLLATLDNRLNDKIVASLNQDSNSSLSYAALLDNKNGLENRLNQMISNSKEKMRERFIKKEQLLSDAPLEAIGDNLGHTSLFARIKTLKLSTKIDEMLRGNLQTYLNNFLAPDILKGLSQQGEEALDFSQQKLPYDNLHQDIQEVRIYKEFINAMHYLKLAMFELEDVDYYKDSAWFFGQASSNYKTIFPIITHISEATSHLTEVMMHPALKTIADETLHILTPLKQMPLVGQYVPSSDDLISKSIPNQSIEYQWKEQQNLIAKHTGSLFYPLDNLPDTADNNKPEQEEVVDSSTLITLQKKIKEQITLPNEVIENLNTMNFSPLALKQLLIALQSAANQLNHMGRSAEVQVEAVIGELTQAFANCLKSSDHTEITLGLKPGALSSSVETKLDELYEAFLNNLPFENIQGRLQKNPIKSIITEARRVKMEKDRNDLALKPNAAQEITAQLFGPQSDAKREAGAPHIGLFTKFKKLQHFNNQDSSNIFCKEINRKRFLETYAKMQPYLTQIDPMYDRYKLLRELQTPSDFANATNTIVALEKQLRELIDGVEESNVIKEQRYNTHIEYLQQREDTVKYEWGAKKTFIKTIEEDLGPYAELFISSLDNPEKYLTEPFNFSSVIIHGNNPIFNTYKAMNGDGQLQNVIKEINSLIKKEEAIIKMPFQDNPCRKQKLKFLNDTKAVLIDPRQFIANKSADTEQLTLLKENLNHYDKLIAGFETLNKMLSSLPDSQSQIKTDKETILCNLRNILSSDEPITDRLEKVKNELSEQKVNSLLADEPPKGNWSRLVRFFCNLFGIKSTEVKNTEKMMGSFKQSVFFTRENKKSEVNNKPSAEEGHNDDLNKASDEEEEVQDPSLRGIGPN